MQRGDQVHRRSGPLGDLHFSRILSVEVGSGVHAETMTERNQRIRSSRGESSYDVLTLVTASGPWRSPESSWPLGRTLSEQRDGIQRLLDASAPETYRGWTGEKVTLIVATVFFAPVGFILLGLVLRLLIPRSVSNEQVVAALQGVASRLRQLPK